MVVVRYKRYLTISSLVCEFSKQHETSPSVFKLQLHCSKKLHNCLTWWLVLKMITTTCTDKETKINSTDLNQNRVVLLIHLWPNPAHHCSSACKIEVFTSKCLYCLLLQMSACFAWNKYYFVGKKYFLSFFIPISYLTLSRLMIRPTGNLQKSHRIRNIVAA